ncbi:hypothetical protein [Pseudoalteromonas sp. MMG005]|uniref:hypothetical protein n=1 Tax=Pseudoalteromonas sp. MMG005 TaxID=2822682 RepID=UPI001B3A75B5|nr:hypothetical protein [Pseudoalteromonas sp. MMG005]MBQ4845054.1 hypothetical protein [Pseudoalteromonas sp. MMG005]
MIERYCYIKYLGIFLMPIYYFLGFLGAIFALGNQFEVVFTALFSFTLFLSVALFAVGLFKEQVKVEKVGKNNFIINKVANVYGSIMLVLFLAVYVLGYLV